jgi:hypothetical protein
MARLSKDQIITHRLELTDSPAKEKVGNGGITVNEESIFIVDNKLWHWNEEQFRDLVKFLYWSLIVKEL